MEKTYRKKRPPYGFNFLDTDATEKMEIKTREIQDLLKKEGFRGVTPASIDYPETFESYENYDAFRFRDTSGDDLWLRSDATVQVIKGFANLLEMEPGETSESKYYYLSSVFRDVRKSYPSPREVYQLGVEVIGAPSNECIDSLILLAHQVLKGSFAIKHCILIGDIRISEFLNNHWENIPVRELSMKRDVPGLISELVEVGYEKDQARELARLLLFPLETDDWFAAMEDFQSKLTGEQSKTVQKILDLAMPLKDLYKKLADENVPVRWDPLLTRKVNYYTGFIFEGYVEGIPNAPLRGGAYDGLVAKYSSMDLPAGGFALDLTSLILL
ncbi:MAG: ATP phosphoribosyltransferase regulatory subunit [Leptospirales bacterium]